MNREKVFDEVRVIFKEVFDDEKLEINDLTNAEDIEDWDSLEQINLIVAMENSFNIKFKLNEVGNLKNVGEMVDLIYKKVECDE